MCQQIALDARLWRPCLLSPCMRPQFLHLRYPATGAESMAVSSTLVVLPMHKGRQASLALQEGLSELAETKLPSEPLKIEAHRELS